MYRCFVIPTDLPGDVFVSGIVYRPGNRRVVHHILSYVDTSGEGRKKDALDSAPGYPCFAGPKVDSIGDMGGWVPGVEPIRLPDGFGKSLPKKADIIVQIHYHPSGKPETDRTQLGLYFAKKPVKRTLQRPAPGTPIWSCPPVDPMRPTLKQKHLGPFPLMLSHLHVHLICIF